jgi:hypothetical protein
MTPKTLPAVASILAAAVFGLLNGSARQFSPDEVAQAAAWEKYLETARIAGSEQLHGPDAITQPFRLSLEKDGRRRFGLWKNVDNADGGVVDAWRYEIAAYRLDKLLGLEMIPATVERRIAGDKGSLQLWIDGTASLKQKTGDGTGVPADCSAAWNCGAFLQRAFDSLIANEDRNANNILVTEGWRMLLIDHSRAFRVKKPYQDRLVFGARGLLQGPDGSPYPLAPLPKVFFEKLKALDEPAIRGAVRSYLSKAEVAAVLARRALIVEEIETLVRENGEDKVLYVPR